MKDYTKTIERFFRAYAKCSNDALKDPPVVDADRSQESFAEYFVESSPVGVVGAKNDARFKKAIVRGYRNYRKIGTTAMKVSGVKVTPIDDMHVMAHVDWDSRYRKDGKEIRIPFTNVYMLQMSKQGPKIFAYVTGDEAEVLKAHGLA